MHKNAPQIDTHKAALALAQWAILGFTQADAAQVTKQHQITYKTLRRWRDKLKTDEHLSITYENYLANLAKTDTIETLELNHWSIELNKTLNAALTKQAELIHKANQVEHLEYVNSAVETLTEIQFARDMIGNELQSSQGQNESRTLQENTSQSSAPQAAN